MPLVFKEYGAKSHFYLVGYIHRHSNMNTTPILIISVLNSGEVTFANPVASAKIWGTHEIGKNIFEKIEFPDPRPSEVHKFLSEFDNTVERTWNLLDNEEIPFPTTMAIMSCENDRFLIVAVDMTVVYGIWSLLQTTEQQLAVNKLAFFKVIQQAPVPMAIFDRNVCYIEASPRWKTEVGIEDLVGMSYYDTVIIPNQWKQIIDACLKDGKSADRRDGLVTFIKCGRIVHVYWAVSPWLNDDHVENGVVVVCESVKELVLAREAAIEASEQKSRFLANMSHELRTPLNGILGFTDILLKELSSAVDPNSQTLFTPESYDLLKIIKESGESLLNLVNDILDFSKIEAGKVDIDPRVFSIHQCLSNVFNMFDYAFRKKNISFSIEIADGVMDYVYADESRLRQILLNLIGNSLKFTAPNGQIHLDVRRKDDDSDLIYFSVADNGIGIASDRIAHLFQSFVQAEVSTSRSYGGTGLGLAISKRLSNLMGGDMWVTSEEGVGSTFYFTIKLPPAEMDLTSMDLFSPLRITNSRSINTNSTLKATPQTTSPKAKLKALRILAAEDNAINIKLLTVVLKKMGYLDVTVVTNGKLAFDAVAASADNPFDVILMDLQMPVESGFDATKRIRKLTDIKQPVIVALTAAAMKEEEAQARSVGMDDIITKPLRQKTIENLFDKYFHSGDASSI
jgi:signal transduction histidine kinase/CheY-like chemotaxis protein